ncbi:MAG: trehalase family glycosidase [Pseudomonadota bacterium]
MNDKLDKQARDILIANDRGGFTVPTGGLYPYQWNWDSVFVALGFATFDEARACQEIETLFEAQWVNGMVPHIVFRRDDPDYFPGPKVWSAGENWPSSGITQPPVVASVVRTLWLASRRDHIRARLADLFPRILAWHRWFHRFRVPSETGAVTITHPWESGRDNSPEWDHPARNVDTSDVEPYTRRDLQHADADMRPTKDDYDRYITLVAFGRRARWDQQIIAGEGPFRVADVAMSMILLRAHRDLADLGRRLGYQAEVDELETMAATLAKGVNYLWDEGEQTFCSRDLKTGKPSGLVTNGSFLYAYAGVGNDVQRAAMKAHWQRIREHCQYTVPSLDPQSPLFDHKRYWRGPVWLMMNYMIARGFSEIGQEGWAEQIRADSRGLVADHGFFEAHSPTTGQGTGGKLFSWTAAMWLAWCGPNAECEVAEDVA